jgi:hypothetical protein
MRCGKTREAFDGDPPVLPEDFGLLGSLPERQGRLGNAGKQAGLWPPVVADFDSDVGRRR